MAKPWTSPRLLSGSCGQQQGLQKKLVSAHSRSTCHGACSCAASQEAPNNVRHRVCLNMLAETHTSTPWRLARLQPNCACNPATGGSRPLRGRTAGAASTPDLAQAAAAPPTPPAADGSVAPGAPPRGERHEKQPVASAAARLQTAHVPVNPCEVTRGQRELHRLCQVAASSCSGQVACKRTPQAQSRHWPAALQKAAQARHGAYGAQRREHAGQRAWKIALAMHARDYYPEKTIMQWDGWW